MTTHRIFETGATRDSDDGKYDYEGFLSPLVIEAFGRYMHKHRKMKDGSLRDSDNWTKGIPRRQYVKSLWRHLMDVWLLSRGFSDQAVSKDIEESLCAIIFNAQGLLHEVLIGRDAEQNSTA